MHHPSATVVLIALAGFEIGVSGCTNGRNGGIAPPNESCVVWGLHDEVRVTDAHGTRTLGSIRDYGYDQKLFSRDGRWLLISGGDWREGGWRRAGDRLTLYETRSGERFDGELPFNIVPGGIPWDSPPGTGMDYFRRTHDLAEEHYGRPAATGRSPIPVCIEDEPRLWFGPIDNHFYIWSPRRTGESWPQRPADHESPPPDTEMDWQLMDTRHERYSSEFVVVIPFDGWNAQRTVWVRPDGEVVELARQNDGPLLPLRLFVGFLGSLLPSNMGGPLAAILYWPYVTVKAPEAIAKQAERDASELVVARERLRLAIERRRLTAASQPVTGSTPH